MFHYNFLKVNVNYCIAILLIILYLSCDSNDKEEEFLNDSLNLPSKKVQVTKISGSWKLYKNGKPFFIKGVAANKYFDRITEFGANTIRIYGVNDTIQSVLDMAHENGISVALGLWMQKPEYGFDYTDEAAVQAQFEEIRSQVLQHKDHPALLLWVIGNELDAKYGENDEKQEMWEAINDVSKMIHQEDGEHPTTIAMVNSSVEKLIDIKKWAPDLNILSSNAKWPQTGLVKLHLEEADWDIPYILSEYGNRALPQGFPESPALDWGGLVEPTSTEKSIVFKDIIENDVLSNTSSGCIGGIAFLWGDQANSQSGSRKNWHAFFTSDGESYGVIDELQNGWSRKYPANLSPIIEDRSKMTLDGKVSFDEIKLSINKSYNGRVEAYDPDGDPLSYKWVVVREGTRNGNQPPGLNNWIESNNKSTVKIKCVSEGAYRLYVFVSDNKGKAANAVIPFLVE